MSGAMVQTRVAHIDAMSRGQSAAEWAPESVAAAELEALWRWVASELGIVLEGIEEEAVAI